jgi:hypothetical protein
MQGREKNRLAKNYFVLALISLSLSACLMDEPELAMTSDDPMILGDTVISGNPPSQVNANSTYNFTPTTSAPDGVELSFTGSGIPVWATLDPDTGRLSGTPGDGDIGTYGNITITAFDGLGSDTLGPFSITVQAFSLGSVTLNWAAPTLNEDGTPLVDLAGYKFYWGTSEGDYPNSVTLNNPGLTTYVVDNLVPGTYEFVATSFNSSGMESDYSNPATKVVQ